MPIAESLGLAALGWVASPVVKDLFAKSIVYLGSDIAKGLEDLETVLLPQFQLTIQAAKNSPHATELKKWLDRLKNAYYDAEAILHEVEYKRLRPKVRSEQDKTWVRISSHPIIKPLAKFTTKVKKVSLLSPQKKKLLKRLNILKDVAAEAKTFRELLKSTEIEKDNGKTLEHRPPITSSLLPHRVFGRDGVRDQIINFLLDMGKKGSSRSSSAFNRSFSVVAITGIGGAGKTTLAQYVYNDERVEKHFGKRMWICLSQKIDVIELTTKMIQCITNKPSKLTELSILQNNLMNALKSEPKGVLLVLDNFWLSDTKAIKEDKEWEDLLAPYTCIRGRIKILTTSRSNKFPVPLHPAEHIKLSDLAATEFRSLFRYYAGLEIGDLELKTAHYTIADEIAKNLSKSPLAARVVGNQLYKNRDIRFWQDTLRNVNLNDTMEVLLWSYQRMDVQLQRCFLFFGVFIRGEGFTANNLVQYWVALDFISAEDVGFEFIDLMLANSMLVKRENGLYSIHDLFHELAKNLSTGDCLRVTDSETVIPSTTILHVSLSVSKENLIEKLSSISSLCNLRTLFLENPLIEDVNTIFSMISTIFTNLRVLEIMSSGYSILPETVGDLKNLRYLDVYGSSIKELPNSVSKLYHLQYLLLPESLNTLAATLRNLLRLQSMGLYDRKFNPVNTFPPVSYIGKLTSLKNLPKFHVRREEGYELQQLRHLREIVGTLSIVGLENVKDKDEAVAAMLIDKPKLTQLNLVWTGSADSIASEVDVIEALQPPTNLKLLTIDGYRGSVYPTWLQDGSTLMYLQSIRFCNCNALEVLPLNFSQFHHCSELSLYNLGAFRELPAFPVNLHKLSINKCPRLTLLRENERQLQVDDFHGIVENVLLPSAGYPWKDVLEIEVKSFERTGSVENCQEQLQIIKSAINRDNVPSEKWKDVIDRAWWPCHQQRMNFISAGTARPNKLELPVRLCILDLSYCCISNGALSDGLRYMASLQRLVLCGIMTITTLPSADVLQTLHSLQDLEIYHCWCLRSLGGLHSLPHVQKINVTGCWGLEIKNHDCALLPPTLQTVIIKGCIISENIFHANLTCLQNVEIFASQVPHSLSFHHVNSLQTLRISRCSSPFSIKLCPVIGTLDLVCLPNLDLQSVLESWPGCQRLAISSSLILNKLLSSQNFVVPTMIMMCYCQEEVISFEKSVHFQSITRLAFVNCNTKNLPTTLWDFSNLNSIDFYNCPEISELPELPSSVQWIKITNCPLLRERCQPNSADWHKIRDIKNKWIE